MREGLGLGMYYMNYDRMDKCIRDGYLGMSVDDY